MKILSIRIALYIITALTTMYVYHSLFQPKVIYIESDQQLTQVSESEHSKHRYGEKLYPPSLENAAERAIDAVVYVLSYQEIKNNVISKEYKREKGSGVIISPDGYIVTNYHVIKDHSHIEIMLNNRREYLAKVVGHDISSDIALLKIEAKNLHSLEFGNSDLLRVGQWIIAVGNPFGFQSTVTAGIISAKARRVQNFTSEHEVETLIQSDVVINPGSSGGAMVNEFGKFVGLNTAVISQSGQYEGISFAIPSNIVKKVISDLKQFGAVQRAHIGLNIRDLDAKMAKKLRLNDVKGVLVEAATFNGVAKQSGLLRNDVILKINNKPVNNSAIYHEQLSLFRPGDQVKIDFYRNGHLRSTTLVLKNYLHTTDLVAIRSNPTLKKIGMEIRGLNSIEQSRLGVSGGVYVVSVEKESPASISNLEPGYIIESLNGISIKDEYHFIQILNTLKKDVALEGFYERFPGKFPYNIYF